MEKKSIIVEKSESGIKLYLEGIEKSELLPNDYSLDDLANKIALLLTTFEKPKSNVEIDLKAGIIRKNGEEQRLLAKEIKILSFFYEHQNEIISREKLLSELWTKNQKETTRTLDVHISRLRQKLGNLGDAQQVIQTVRGIGYKFIAP
jgi:DNA-binding response OmpR family regulator